MKAKVTNSLPNWRLQVHALKLLALITLLAGIAACAAGGKGKMYFHDFSFNSNEDARKYGHPEVEVLDYAYGDSHQFGTYPSKEDREMRALNGTGYAATSIGGQMPRGEFLYVKWRVKSTGQVYEDRVDLRHRLPADVTQYGIHFLVDGAQLYIYAFPPYETKDVFGRTTVNGGSAAEAPRGQTLRDVPFNQKYQIYPDLSK